MRQTTNEKGFTLIEIIVVVAIIGILLTIAAASYTNSLRRGRDQRRIVNIETLRSNLELFKSSRTAGTYPLLLSELTTAGFTVPADPQGTANPYTYAPVTSAGAACDNTTTFCSRYTLSTNLEIMGSTYTVTPSSSAITFDRYIRRPVELASRMILSSLH